MGVGFPCERELATRARMGASAAKRVIFPIADKRVPLVPRTVYEKRSKFRPKLVRAANEIRVSDESSFQSRDVVTVILTNFNDAFGSQRRARVHARILARLISVTKRAHPRSPDSVIHHQTRAP